MAKLAPVGTLFPVATKQGPRHGFVSHVHEDQGEVVRMLYPSAESSPSVDQILAQPVVFNCLFPVAAAIRQKLIENLGVYAVPEHLRTHPTFRRGGRHHNTRKLDRWILWDGEREWRVDQLTEEQRKLSPPLCPSMLALVDWLESGWTPDNYEVA